MIKCYPGAPDGGGRGTPHSRCRCWLMLIFSGEMSLAAIDALGWGIIVFIALIFGIPYSRYFLRTRAITSWPTAEATVVAAAACRGSPVGREWGSALLNHCSVDYEYQVHGVSRRGWFALMAGNEAIATTVAQQILNKKILIRFNPKHPTDSIPVAEEILERKVVGKQSWLNPNVW